MVHILPNGDVVPDDDQRLQRQRARPTANINTLSHDDEDERMYEGQGQGQGQNSPVAEFFTTVNQRLLGAGVPRWNLGPYTVEPIVSVAFLLALLFIGVRGLLFGLLLFFATKWSMGGGGRRGQSGGNRRPPPRPNQPGQRPGGGGQRLGRS